MTRIVEKTASPPISHRFLGHLFDFRRDPPGFYLQTMIRYGILVKLRFAWKRVILVSDPALVRHILVTSTANFPKASRNLSIFSRTMGKGLLSSEGALHARQRKAIQPGFQHQRLSYFAKVMRVEITQLLDRWESDQRISIQEVTQSLTTTIATQAFFGTELGADNKAVCARILELQALSFKLLCSPVVLPAWIPIPTHLAMRRQRKLMDDLINNMIAKRRASKEDHGDLLSALLFGDNPEQRMNDQQLRDEVVTLFAAGHETTAHALSWAFIYLANHPQHRHKLEAEVDRVLVDRLLTTDVLKDLPWCEAIVKETLRLRPTAWALTTRMCKQSVELAGHQLKHGDLVMISPYAMHQNPQYFDAPERFDPARWIDGRCADLPRMAFLPFGAGPHVCIGQQFAMQELVMVLAAVAHGFRVDPEIAGIPDYHSMITLFPDAEVFASVKRR